ncbi:uncharacterized protein LOC114523260 [Dendronephthya gigantea]|uniref:uncharacterized protein LOC114523260 n=1 Tax=Dendronephthya gigantea TaxID=151771 RepID=UPI00106AFEAF|nr:uncharacterized protein LOC114523260 [Dendronephthya gigantea]
MCDVKIDYMSNKNPKSFVVSLEDYSQICSKLQINSGRLIHWFLQVPGNDSRVERQDYSKARNLRSNPRSASSSHPIRINRDCLKVIPGTNDRVVKRTRPFVRKGETTKSGNTTSQTSAINPRALVPSAIKSQSSVPAALKSRIPLARITSHSCVKPPISTTITQASTRVLRSHGVSKTLSSKAVSCSAAKISTANNLNTATSSRILRSHVSSTRDAATASTRSKIPRFSWNLRRSSSVSKAESLKKKDGEEIGPLGKQNIPKEAEHTTLGKRSALSEKSLRPDIKNDQKKPKNDLEVNALRPEEHQRKLEAKLTEPRKAVDLKLTKSIPVNAEISTVPQNKSLSITGCEEFVDVASHEKSLVTSEHVVVTGEPSLVEEPSVETSHQVPDSLAPTVPAKPRDEKTLTPADSEIKILDEDIDTSQQTPSPSAQVDKVVEFNLVAKPLVQELHLEGQTATLGEEISVKGTRENESPLKENSAFVKRSAEDDEINGSVKPPIPAKVQHVSDEIPALTDIPIVTEQTSEETSASDNISTVEKAVDLEIAVKQDEVISDVHSSPQAETLSLQKPSESGFRDDTSVVQPTTLQGVAEATSVVNTSKPCTLTVAVKADRFPVTTHTEISTVQDELSTASKKHFDRVGVSTCYGQPNKQTTVFQNEKLLVVKPLTTIECVKVDKVKIEEKSCLKSSKRPASLTPIDNHCILKKRRNASSENSKDETSCFSSPVQSCSSQTMEIGSPITVPSNVFMDVDPSVCSLRNVSNFAFEQIPGALNTQSGLNDAMELSESSQTLPFAFGNIQEQTRPMTTGFSFATSDQQARQSFGINKAQNGFVFHSNPVVDGFPGRILNQATQGFQLITFGRVQPQQDNHPMPGLNQTNLFQIFGNPLQTQRPTLVNSDGSHRKFIFTKGHRRRNNVHFHPNQTNNQNTPPVFASGFQTGLNFGMVVQSPTPMESEDVNSCSGNGSQRFDVQQNHQFICGSSQEISGQNINDHSMEDIVQSPPLMVCDSSLPQPRSTVSCFEISQQTMAGVERRLSLPAMTMTTQVVVPTTPFLLQPARLQLPSAGAKSSANSVWEHRSKLDEQLSTSSDGDQGNDGMTLRMDSSALSLDSSNSSLNDCRSDIVDDLTESVSNCSLEDSCTTMDDIGRLIEMFKTLSIDDTGIKH